MRLLLLLAATVPAVSGRGWSAVPAEPDERLFAPIAAFHRQSANALDFLGLRAATETGAAGPSPDAARDRRGACSY